MRDAIRGRSKSRRTDATQQVPERCETRDCIGGITSKNDAPLVGVVAHRRLQLRAGMKFENRKREYRQQLLWGEGSARSPNGGRQRLWEGTTERQARQGVQTRSRRSRAVNVGFLSASRAARGRSKPEQYKRKACKREPPIAVERIRNHSETYHRRKPAGRRGNLRTAP